MVELQHSVWAKKTIPENGGWRLRNVQKHIEVRSQHSSKFIMRNCA